MRLPDFGPLQIHDWEVFLHEVKEFFNENWAKPMTHKEKLHDFHQIKLLANGTFGDVILIKNKRNDTHFAMKAIEKARIIQKNLMSIVKNEKSLLQALNFPMTIYLVYFFQNNSYIYLVMPFIPGGELFEHMRKMKRVSEVQARFFASQIILALEYLHFLDLVYRDLKPENILIDHTGYLKLTDFGFCKKLLHPRTYTICGTPEYIAPDIILGRGYGKSVDWWGTGVLIYEMVVGTPPFFSIDIMKLYTKIVSGVVKFPLSISRELKDLIKGLLQRDLTRRYGNTKNGVNEIKDHKWFSTINWMAILNRKVKPLYTPKYENAGDTDHFRDFDWIPPKVCKENKFGDAFDDF